MLKRALIRVISPGYEMTVSLNPVSYASGDVGDPSKGWRSTTRNCVA